MKKFYCFILIFLAITSCFVFSACGNKYSNLGMEFYGEDGEVIKSVQLVLNDDTLSSTEICVSFSGIDADEVGQVSIQSSPAEAVTISDYVYDGTKVYATITANMTCSSGALTVYHLSSGKTSSIPFVVDSVSSAIELKSDTYIVSIPADIDEECSVSINSSSLVSLLPEGSTDLVYFKAVNYTSYKGITLETVTIEGDEYISGFTLTSEAQSGVTLTLYPVTYVKGFAVETYRDEVITFVFEDTITADSIYLKTDSLHQSYLDACLADQNQVIYLVANDTGSTTDLDTGISYNYNNFQIDVKQIVGSGESVTYSEISEFYDIRCVSSNSAVNVISSGENFIIQATEYTSSPVKITVSLVPNTAGDLATVTKTFYVKGEAKADAISVYFQGGETSLDLHETVDIYNYYSSTGGSSLGALFNFVSGVETNYSDLKSMRIVIAPQILNASLTDDNTGDGETRVNAIYTDATFSTAASSSDINNASSIVRTNKYVLEFYIGSRALKFYFDGTNFVSEEISENDNIYIKYREISKTSSDATLEITVETYYTGNLDYLADISGVDATISFDRKEGVASMTINAGYFEDKSNITIYKQTGTDTNFTVETIYLNVLDVYDATSGNTTSQYLLYIDTEKLLDGNDIKITSATFEVTVSGASENSLKIVQSTGNLDTALALTASETITFETSTSSPRNAILLIYDADTTCGNYTITFTAGNGFTKSVQVFVYKDILSENISYALDTENRDNAFYNVASQTESETTYTFADYTADYIVASGQSLDLEVVLEDIVETSIIAGYDFDASWADGSGDGESVESFLKVSMANNAASATLSFLKGSYFNTQNNYIKLTITVKVSVYDNIITASTETKSISIDLSFFIYDEIEYDDLSLSDSYILVYMNDLLGAYYTDQSIATISVNMTADLWNYVQSAAQYASYSVGISTKTETVDDRNGGETTTDVQQYYQVVWYTNSVGSFVTNEQAEKSITLTFYRYGTSSSYSCEIHAYIYQFNKVFDLACHIEVKAPTITESLVLNSDAETYDEEDGGYYINLKANETYTVDVTSISSQGEITNADIYLVVVDQFGYQNSSSVTVDNENLTITVTAMGTSLRLIVLAKDALSMNIDTVAGGFDDLSSILLANNGSISYKNAYIIIDLILSDGTESNPYLILNADDFYEIDDTTAGLSAYYMIMNDINLATGSNAGNTASINGFSGTITTYNGNIYSIYGITLDADMLNVFTEFSGSITNVNFVVKYAYNLSDSSYDYILGVFGKVYGEEDGEVYTGAVLTNVTAEISGTAELDVDSRVYFGGLVGYNDGGTIQYTASVIGVSGEIELSGTATKVFFGGLVGYNSGTITGYTATDDGTAQTTPSGTTYSFEVYIDNSGSITSVDIVSNIQNTGDYTATLDLGGTGGIVGYNTGTISDAYVSGTITASGNNVGGAVGVNVADTVASTVTAGTASGQVVVKAIDFTAVASISDVTSVVQIQANNYVGGIVGYSEGGYYTSNRYQILASYTYGLSGVNYVGGIAGYSYDGIFKYCSVMSYRWDYNLLRDENDYSAFASSGTADISGTSYVAGIVGGAKNTQYYNNTLSKGDIEEGKNENIQLVTIISSSVNAYISAGENVAGLLSNINTDTSTGHNISIAFNAYFMGRVSGGVNYETITNVDVYYFLVSNDTYTDYNYVYTVVVDDTNALNIADFNDNAGAFNIGESDDSYTYTICTNAEFDSNATYYSDQHGTVASDITAENFETKKNEIYTRTLVFDKDGWEYNAELNGGYVYIVDSDGEPLFEVAPTLLTASGVSNRLVSTSYTDLIHLDYYAFNLNTASENYNEIYTALTEKYNTYSITDIIEFTCLPTSLTSVRLLVSSSNSSIISVSGEKITVCGVGQVVLTFTSVLNSAVTAKITIDVSYPVGDNLLSESAVDSTLNIAGTTQNITAGDAVLYYMISTGELVYDGTTYSYTANSDLYLYVTISLSGATLETGYGIEDYIKISGQDWQTDGENLYVLVDPNTPFSVSVLRYLSGATFTITIEPYTVVNYLGEDLMIYTAEEISFDVVTFKGATDFSLSYDAVTLYPNDATLVKAYITTDIELDLTDEEWAELTNDVFKYVDVYLIDDGEETKLTASYYVQFYLNYGWSDGIQTVYFKVIFDDTHDEFNLDEESTLKISFVLKNGTTRSVEFTVLPQRINKIEIKNYIYDDTEKNTVTLSSVLRPNSEGLIIIDIAPINGYFDYLEISDVTGNEEILFAQIDSVGGARLSTMDETSSDGKGIKLIKTSSTTSTLYVSTRISASYTSKTHTIRVTAYLADGTAVSETFYYKIQAKMLPTIELEYKDPNGDTVFSDSSTSEMTDTYTHYLANAVDANFNITTANSDGNLDVALSLSNGFDAGQYYSLYEVRSGSGNYILEYINSSYNSSLLGATLTITLSTTATQANGDFETTTLTFSFTIVRYVIHNISVTHSKSTSTGYEIYGDYGTTIDLEFYFKPTDISYYDGNSFWEKSYTYADLLETYGSVDIDTDPQYLADPTYQIYWILLALNTDRSESNLQQNKYISIIFYNSNGNEDSTVGSISGNTLSLDSGYATLTISFTLYLHENVDSDGENDDYMFTLTNSSKGIDISRTYAVNFTNSSSFEEPIAIYSAEEFLAMQSGDEVYYILATNITLTDYTPLDVDIRSFDGNGYTITIESFAESTDDTLLLGLFSQIYEDMMVINLRVSYTIGVVTTLGSTTAITYEDFASSDGSTHSALYFGGITPTNNGIISNCEVTGTLAIDSSAVEITGSDHSVDIFVGGLVEENASTGYITNSTSSLAIYGIFNVGGVAYTNSGKIVSTAFDQGSIFAYTTDTLYNTIIVNVGGFVYENSGEISMSYVDLESIIVGSTKYGALSVKDMSAGFAYSNTGTIKDCYVDISYVYGYNNTFVGFVYTNSGTIATSYTYINGGNRNSQTISMFAPSSTTGITDCYELINSTSGYTSGVSGLTTITKGFYLQVTYDGFNFGDNSSSVWVIKSGLGLPKLVATQENVALEGGTDSYYLDADGNKVYNTGLKTITRVVTTLDDGEGHLTYVTTDETSAAGYGTESNPYLIYDVDTWVTYFSYNPYGYFRIITDIDFSEVYSNVATSTLTYSGNIQGNNMTLSGIVLYSASSLEGIGLFKELVGADDASITNSVRNLTLEPSSIRASRTTMVGVLAGLIENFNLYNISVDADGVILVGGNAVGGLAGVVRGKFDVQGITSNVGANSNRASVGNSYNVYLSKNNSADVSSNITSVYYAGSVFGILDGYNNASYNINSTRDLSKSTYFAVKDVTVTGNSSVLGDTVGGAFGFVGERVRVTNVEIDFAGALSGYQYSGGVAGENRGVIENATFTSSTSATFTGSENVSAGIVGFNLGGLVDTVSSSFSFTRTASTAYTVAGVVGRNVNGYIQNATFDGEILAYYTGGIVGADYSDTILTSRSSGAGSLTTGTQSAVPTSVTYYDDDGIEITNKIYNVSVSADSLTFWFENMSKFYYYSDGFDSLTEAIKYLKVLGLAVGITDNSGLISSYRYDSSNNQVVFNYPTSDGLTNVKMGLVADANLVGDVSYTLLYSNILSSAIAGLDYTYVTYVVGATVAAFDTWAKSAYSSERLVFTNETVISLTIYDDDSNELTGYICDGSSGYEFRDLSGTASYIVFDPSYITDDAIVTYYVNYPQNGIVINDLNTEIEIAFGSGNPITITITTTDEDGIESTESIVFVNPNPSEYG